MFKNAGFKIKRFPLLFARIIRTCLIVIVVVSAVGCQEVKYDPLVKDLDIKAPGDNTVQDSQLYLKSDDLSNLKNFEMKTDLAFVDLLNKRVNYFTGAINCEAQEDDYKCYGNNQYGYFEDPKYGTIAFINSRVIVFPPNTNTDELRTGVTELISKARDVEKANTDKIGSVVLLAGGAITLIGASLLLGGAPIAAAGAGATTTAATSSLTVPSLLQIVGGAFTSIGGFFTIKSNVIDGTDAQEQFDFKKGQLDEKYSCFKPGPKDYSCGY